MKLEQNYSILKETWNIPDRLGFELNKEVWIDILIIKKTLIICIYYNFFSFCKTLSLELETISLYDDDIAYNFTSIHKVLKVVHHLQFT